MRSKKATGLGLAVCVVAAASIAAGSVDLASAHNVVFPSKVTFVPGSQPGTHAVQVTSSQAKCVRERHVTWYRQSGTVVFANYADSTGLAEPRQPFAAQAGDYAVAGLRKVRSTADHKHKCRKTESRPFAG